MSSEIPPFQLHLMLKLENGQALTPNELRKMQQLGLEDPWLSNPSQQPDVNQELEGSRGDDGPGEKKQKDDASAVKSDDTLQDGSSIKPTGKWRNPRVPDRFGGFNPCSPCWPIWPAQPTSRLTQDDAAREWFLDDWNRSRDADSSMHSKYITPDWKIHPEKYPRGPPVPPWLPIQYFSHWSQAPGNNAQGNFDANSYPAGTENGRNDTRESPMQSFRYWNLPPDAMQPTRRDPSGRPLPHPWDGAGGSDWNMGFRNFRWNLPPEAMQPTRRDPNGRPLPHPWDGAGGSDWNMGFRNFRWNIPDWAMQPTRRDPNGRPLPHPWDGAGGSDWNMGFRNYRLSDGVYPNAQPTRTFPTHIPYRPGFLDRNWRQVITTNSEGEAANHAQLNGSPVRPSQTYAWQGAGVALRVGTGGSDQSGLLVKLFDQYLQQCVEVKQETPFLVEFYASDSALTIDYLTDDIIDLGFTDTILLDTLVKAQGIIDRKETAWRGHWMLVGPKDNPVGLPERDGTSVHALFATLYSALQADRDSPTIFLSRSDSSSSYVKESSIWSAIGRAPSTSASATWYASSGSLAAETLAEAALIGAYTLTDSDTWYSASEETRSKLISLTLESDDEQDPLLKPAELVVGSGAKNKDRANDFVDWLIAEDGGQEVIKAFEVGRSATGPAATQASSKTAGETMANEAT